MENKPIIDKNLSNITENTDLFGNKIQNLSVKDRIGFYPLSIWQTDPRYTKRLKDKLKDGEARQQVFQKSKKCNYAITESIFNPELAQMIVAAYSPPKARIYDPFGGGGTRGFIATIMGHDYYGVELRQDEIDAILKKQKELDLYFNIAKGDSRQLFFEENSFDFSFTCPPYYNLEKYNGGENDLSMFPTYSAFLNGLKDSVKGVYKALKKGSFSVWVVGVFRDKRGELLHFNGDLARMGKEIGFKLHDEVIFKFGGDVAKTRSTMFQADRKTVRIHEYLIVFKKEW